MCIELCVPLLCSDDAEDLNVDSGLRVGGGHAEGKSVLVDINDHGAEDMNVDSGLKVGGDAEDKSVLVDINDHGAEDLKGPGTITTIPSTKTSSSDPSTLSGSDGKDDLPWVVNSERRSRYCCCLRASSMMLS